MATACELCAQRWPWVCAPGIMPAPGVGEGEAEPQPVASRRQPSTAAMKTHLVAIYTGRGKPAPQEWVANSNENTVNCEHADSTL